MTFGTLLVTHLILFIICLQLLLVGKIKNWPEFAVIAAAIYSFSGFFVTSFIQHNHYGGMADFIIILLGGMFILMCIVMTLLLTFKGLANYDFLVKLCALVLVIWLGNFLSGHFQQENSKTDSPQIEEPLEPKNAKLEAENRALEQGIDPKNLEK